MNYPSATSTSPETDLLTGFDRQVDYAGFWRRFLAVFIDSIVIQIVNMLVAAAMGYPVFDVSREYFDPPALVGLVIGWLYFAVQESSPAMGTLGKRAVGIRVTTMDGDRISFARATGRHFARYLSTILLLIGYLMMLWDSKKQTLHDKMAETLVIKDRNY
jgi:uncharacterized RDD family membrane protein YckC